MKVNPSSSNRPANSETGKEMGKSFPLSQSEVTHNVGTLYIRNANAKFEPTQREFDADRRNNLGKEERRIASDLANLAIAYGRNDARGATLNGLRCSDVLIPSKKEHSS
jgi:hypothetical protein